MALSQLRFITRYLEDWQAVLRYSYQLPYFPVTTHQSLKSTPNTHSFRSIGKASFTP